MQILDEATRGLVTVPNDMEADCCFTYEGRPLFRLGGIFPGDLICIRSALQTTAGKTRRSQSTTRAMLSCACGGGRKSVMCIPR